MATRGKCPECKVRVWIHPETGNTKAHHRKPPEHGKCPGSGKKAQ
jgi:hypothetical protein